MANESAFDWMVEFRRLSSCGLLDAKGACDKFHYTHTPEEAWKMLGSPIPMPIEKSEKTVDELKSVLREVIRAIEGGPWEMDKRGKVYRQEFGEAFLNKLKEVVNAQ